MAWCPQPSLRMKILQVSRDDADRDPHVGPASACCVSRGTLLRMFCTLQRLQCTYHWEIGGTGKAQIFGPYKV